jgi:hypothetical protein
LALYAAEVIEGNGTYGRHRYDECKGKKEDKYFYPFRAHCYIFRQYRLLIIKIERMVLR